MHRFVDISVIICISSAVLCLSGTECLSGEVIAVSNASVLLLHSPSNSLYLGARDSILVLDPANLTHKGPVIEWKVSDEEKATCMVKGISEDECHNYICLLESLGDGSIYVCGSYAYNPQCAYIVGSTLRRGEGGQVDKRGGKGLCPYKPGTPHTAVKADGILYSASTTNFLGTEFDVARVSGPEKEQLHIQPTWLSDPEFVTSAVMGAEPKQTDYIYWFLMENAREFESYSPVRVTRVARVCKHDLGGSKTLQGRWTTFLKTGLVCKERGQRGRRYDVLIHLQPLEHQPGDPTSTHFYGLFTSQWGSELVSAVCVFSVAEVDKVMATSRFKDMKILGNTATSSPVPSPRPGLCIGSDSKPQLNSSLQMPDQVLTFAKEHPQLTQPVEASPLLLRKGVRYTRLAVSKVTSTQAAVLYLGTDHGELHSVSVVGSTVTLLQEIPVTLSAEPINNILLHQGAVLVGSASSLRVQAGDCSSFSSCEVCAVAGGLDCGWNATTQTCVAQPPGSQEATGNVCVKTAEAACEDQELRVRQGVRLLLPCTSLSLSPSPPCTWTHPPDRHTRLLPSSYLEVLASPSSQGSYSCQCPAGDATSLGLSACPAASYKLVLETIAEGRSESLHSQSPGGVYVVFLLVGVLCGALVAVAVLKWRERSTSRHISLVDRRGSVATGQGNQNPICYANNGIMMGTEPGQ